MARNAKKNIQVVHLPIEGEMTIFVVQKLREAIMPVIAASEEIEINLSAVTDVDAAGMQLMVSVKLEAILRGKTLHFVGHSKPVLNMIDLCDLGSFFGDQIIIQSA